MPASTSPPVSHETWRLASIWAGMLAGPIVWLVLLAFNYMGAYVACETHRTWFLHAAVVVALVLVAMAGVLSWRARLGPAAIDDHVTMPLSDDTHVQRSNWMAVAGTALSAWFLVVILAMEVPILVLRECQ